MALAARSNSRDRPTNRVTMMGMIFLQRRDYRRFAIGAVFRRIFIRGTFLASGRPVSRTAHCAPRPLNDRRREQTKPQGSDVMGLLVLILGLVLFLGVHTLTTQRELRAGFVASMGEGGYKIAY